MIALACVLAGAAGGSWWTARALGNDCPDCVCPPAPDCVCPAAVSLQTFDLEKLNNKRGSFTYNPQLENVTIQVTAADSVWMKRAIETALREKVKK